MTSQPPRVLMAALFSASRHPQLFLLPLRKDFAIARVSLPQSHRQRHLALLWLSFSALSTTTSRPNRWPVKSITVLIRITSFSAIDVYENSWRFLPGVRCGTQQRSRIPCSPPTDIQSSSENICTPYMSDSSGTFFSASPGRRQLCPPPFVIPRFPAAVAFFVRSAFQRW